MTLTNIVLIKCWHASSNGMAKGCPACKGSGFVKVIPGEDGKPKRCIHANNNGSANGCEACKGSGWAGVILNTDADSS